MPFEGLLDSLAEALVVLDPSLRILEWNVAMQRLTGVSRADAVGRNADAALPLFRDQALAPLVRRALAGETPGAIEQSHTMRDDDRVVRLEARCAPWRDGKGAIAGAVTVLTDISDRQHRALLLHAMEAIGHSLTSSLDLNEVLDTIVGKALEVMDAESAVVVLGDATSGEYRVMRAAGRLSQKYAAAIAIHNASRYEAEHGQATRIRALTDVNRRISSALELDALLRTISESAAELTGARLASFWLADEKRRKLSFTSGSRSELVEEYSPRILSYEQGSVGWVASHRRALVVDDVLADPRLVNRAWVERWGLRSFAGYPVLVGDELLAVMALANTEPLRFGADTQDLIDMFLAQAAIAIQNARAYREAQRRRDVAEVLARLARELTATLEVEPIAKLLARGAAELVNARAAGVYLVEPEEGSLHALAAYGADADIMRALVLKPGDGAVGRAVAERRIV